MKYFLTTIIVIVILSSSCTKSTLNDPILTGTYYGLLHKNSYYLGYRPPHFIIDSIIHDTLSVELLENHSPQSYFIRFNREKKFFETTGQYTIYKNEEKSNLDSLVFDYDYHRDENHWYGLNHNRCTLVYYYKTKKVRLQAQYSTQDAYFNYSFLEN